MFRCLFSLRRHEWIRKTDGPRLYVECMNCLKASDGIWLRPQVQKSTAAYPDGSRVTAWTFMVPLFLLLFVFSCGCAAKKPQHVLVMHSSDVQRVIYDRKKCKTLDNGNVICDRVVFVPKSVHVD